MVVDCGWCKAIVDAKVLGYYEVQDEHSDDTYRFSLLPCPNCQAAIFVRQYYDQPFFGDQSEASWSKPDRLWPYPDENYHRAIPDEVRMSLLEARKSLNATAFMASSVMCGKALEELCKNFAIKDDLFNGLAELKKKEIIDKRIYEWGEEIRKLRNVAAHASGESVDPSDAKDLLEFTEAICEYVFVLTSRFEEFKQRKETRAKQTTKPIPRIVAKPVAPPPPPPPQPPTW